MSISRDIQSECEIKVRLTFFSVVQMRNTENTFVRSMFNECGQPRGGKIYCRKYGQNID